MSMGSSAAGLTSDCPESRLAFCIPPPPKTPPPQPHSIWCAPVRLGGGFNLREAAISRARRAWVGKWEGRESGEHSPPSTAIAKEIAWAAVTKYHRLGA